MYFSMRFIEIKIISGDVGEASEFVLMISDIGSGVKRRIVTAPEISSLTESRREHRGHILRELLPRALELIRCG